MISYECDQYVNSTISIRNRKIVNLVLCLEAYKSARKSERNSGRITEPNISVKNGPIRIRRGGARIEPSFWS